MQALPVALVGHSATAIPQGRFAAWAEAQVYQPKLIVNVGPEAPTPDALT
jgi:hypothetical protein